MARKQLPKKQIRPEVITITPELAKEWLDKNTHNRRMGPSTVRLYAEAMKNGEWRLNGEPIIFDWNDVLQNGQNRLAAIIEANVTIDALVVFDADPDNLYTLDVPRRRSLKDALYLRGVTTDRSALSAAITWSWRLANGRMEEKQTTGSLPGYLKWYDENEAELLAALHPGGRLTAQLGWSRGLMAALVWYIRLVDEEDADIFVDQLVNQVDLKEGSPILAYAGWSRRAKINPSRRPSSVTIAANFIKAWNAFRQHRTLNHVVYRGGESFPEAI